MFSLSLFPKLLEENMTNIFSFICFECREREREEKTHASTRHICECKHWRQDACFNELKTTPNRLNDVYLYYINCMIHVMGFRNKRMFKIVFFSSLFSTSSTILRTLRLMGAILSLIKFIDEQWTCRYGRKNEEKRKNGSKQLFTYLMHIIFGLKVICWWNISRVG